MGITETLFLLIGIAIIGLGIYVKIHNYRMLRHGEKVTAVVAFSEPANIQIAGEEIGGYKNTIYIPTAHGTIEKELTEEHPRKPDDHVSGFYIEQSDQFMKEEDVKQNQGAGPYFLIAFGVLWCGIILIADWMHRSDRGAAIGSRIFGYGICLVFIAVGVWTGIIPKLRRKKECSDSHTGEERVVDYRGSNPETSGSAGRIGWVFLVVGLLVLAILIAGEVQQREDGGSRPISGGEDADAQTGASGAQGQYDSIGDQEQVSFDMDEFKSNLNAEGYCYQAVSMQMPQDIESVEYFYVPVAQERGLYGYQLVLYDNGVGQLTLFPTETVPGRSFRQFISFWSGTTGILQIGEDLEKYDFTNLCAEEAKGGELTDYGIFVGTPQGEISESVYYNDGKERSGSSGISIQAEPFGTVRAHMIDAVPDSVWAAAEAEMQTYFKE